MYTFGSFLTTDKQSGYYVGLIPANSTDVITAAGTRALTAWSAVRNLYRLYATKQPVKKTHDQLILVAPSPWGNKSSWFAVASEDATLGVPPERWPFRIPLPGLTFLVRDPEGREFVLRYHGCQETGKKPAMRWEYREPVTATLIHIDTPGLKSLDYRYLPIVLPKDA